jgi:GIY-YIG catalytic domain
VLTNKEISWIRDVLSDYDPFAFEISPSYFHKKKTEFERNKNKEFVRKELDLLRGNLIKVTPEELLVLKNAKERAKHNIDSPPGIYIIQNCELNKYYIGQSESIFDRAYRHFKGSGSVEVYEDYCSGHTFSISVIPLESTSFLTLNELEDNAIRAYNALVPSGYNKNPGNVLDTFYFKNNDYQKVADLILDKIKGTETFLTLTNNRKRLSFIIRLFKEFDLPRNAHFEINFVEFIKAYQKANKKKK